MRSLFLRAAALFIITVFGAATGFAFHEPVASQLADFDGRTAKRGEPPPASAKQQTAIADLRARVPKLRFDFDGLTGAPRAVSVQDGFLTGANGESKTASASVPTAAVVAGDSNGPVKAFLQEQRDLFGHGAEVLTQARIVREYTTPHNGMQTVAWQQEVDGIPVFEAVLVAHTTKRGELINVSSGFVPDPVAAANVGAPNRAAVAVPPLTGSAAVVVAARNVGESITESDVEVVEVSTSGPENQQKFQAQSLLGEATTSLIWVPMSRQEFRLCWDVILTSRLRGEMFRVFVDAQNGEVILRRGLTRYISDASYRVYTSDSPSPFSPGHSTPLTSQPPLTSRALVTLPALSTNASPNGWINDGINETTGNNVDAHTDRDNNNSPDLPRPTGLPFRVFDFAMNPATQDPTNYMPAAVVQLFYLCNWYHDKLYELGFTEAAGNFQINNFGRGGFGNDPVQADAQDGGGVNNANFSTPPDGSPGRMQMYIFSGPNPRRDGDFDAEIVIHEYTHGLSWRLVGGGQGLGTSQSDGMGEGWSDFYGLALLSEAGDTVNGCYAAGGYATYQLSGLTANYYYGIRRYPYSTDMSKNPLTFKDIDSSLASPHTGIPRSPIIGNTPSEVHNQGEVWCVALWEARANLISKHGWAVGNQLILQLVTDGMKLTPPSPNFLQARDAILQADLVNTGGANRNELWAAFAKRGMGLSATSPASTSNNGIFEAYDVPDDLFIAPTLILSSGGTVGGPFSPNPASFILTNTGSTTINWSLLNVSSWISVSPSSGVLLSGGPSATVNVTILPEANSFPLGTHIAELWFTNQTSGVVQSRSFELSVAGLNMSDDFDPDLDLPQWSGFGGTVGSTVLAINYGGSISAPNSLWFGDASSRFATTIPIDTRGGGDISFAVRLANGSDSTWETADALPSEGVVLECSTNGGSSWTLLGSYDTAAYYNWTAESFPIPAAAQSAATRFRWRQKSHSGSGFDHWALEDVMINAVPAQYLGLSLPATAAEGVPFVMGMVTASPAPMVDTAVYLDSSDFSEIAPSSPVVILAGQTNADVVLYIVDDGEFDGSQPVTITASAVGFQNGLGTMTVEDNEVATLSVSLPPNTTEGAGSVSGAVRLDVIPTADILVGLNSSDLTEIQVPATVLIPAGQTSAVFTVTVLNDNLIDGAQIPTVTAHVANWVDGLGAITVLDNETVNLAVSLPVSSYENAGLLSGAGQVWLSGSLPTNLVVSLNSSDLSEATVSGSTTVPAGQTNASFDITTVDDLFVDGVRVVQITASGAGFNNGTNSMSVLDDESPPPPTNPVPLNLASNVVANTSLSWSNGIAGVTNDVYFGTSPGGGQLVLQGSTTGTNWTLPLLSPNTTYYWRIIAQRVGSTIGPVWRFTTRSVDHFEFNPIPSPEFVNLPFPVTITARDEFNSVVSNYTGTVSLTGWSGLNGVTLFADNFEDGDLAGWTIGSGSYVRSVTNDTAAGGSYSLSLTGGSSSHANGVSQSFTNITPTSITFHVRASANNVAGGYFIVGTNILANDQVVAWFFMSNDGTMGINEDVGGWHGVPYAAGQWYKISLQLDWTNKLLDYFVDDVLMYSDIPFRGPALTGLTVAYLYNFHNTKAWWDEIEFSGGSLASPVIISPTNSGSFANGEWTGSVTVSQLVDRVYLHAADPQGFTGDSADFAVVALNDLALSMATAPDPVVIGQFVTNVIVVTNSGPSIATGVFVTNVVSAEASLISASTTLGSYSVTGNQVTFNLGTLAGATTATMSVTELSVNGGTITNSATVVRAEADGYAANNEAQTTTLATVPTIVASGSALVIDNCGGGDGAIDPNEPVTIRLGLRNAGNFPVSNLVATLLPTGGVLAPSGPQTYGALLPGGATVSNTFNLIATGTCGGTLVVTLQLQIGPTVLGTVSFNFQLGTSTATLTQNFDGVTSPTLPAGWTATLSGAGSPWTTSSAQRDTLPNAVYAPDPSTTCNNTLTSPLFFMPTNGGQLTFRHAYSTESCCDGGLLEISIAGGAFTELLAAGGSFATNGYNSGNSWRGTSLGFPAFLTTVANLPVSARGQNIQLRWRFFADSSVAGAGWYVDTISVGGGFTCCVAPPPPAIVSQPADTNVYVGANASFTVALTGWTPMFYQWKKDGVNLPQGTNQTLSLLGVTTNAAGGYSVVVSNAYGSVTSSKAYLTVFEPEIVNSTAISIADASVASPYPSTITVAGFTGAVAKVTVALRGVNHSFPDDLDVLLVGPTGTNVLLMSDAGGHADLPGVTLTFDDQATSALPDADQIIPGTYRPANFGSGDVLPAPAPPGVYGANLAVFNGTDPNGDWRLFVADDEIGDAGNISSGWSLRITVAGPGVPEFLPVQAVGGQIQLRFATFTGQSYTVQYKNLLTDADWQNLQTITGDGTIRTVLDSINTGGARFYRIRMP